MVSHIPGLTDNISIVSIVGRFLEHSRVFCFGADEDRQMYISSADLMTRNTERRVEITCPILDEELKQRIYSMLETMLMDNTKAWEQFPDGRYILRHKQPDMPINSQEIFIEQARRLSQQLPDSEQKKKVSALGPIVATWRQSLRAMMQRN